MIDIHAHLLPGLDDGPEDETLLLKMLKIAEADGIQQVIVTPHIMPGIYNNSFGNIKEALDNVNKLISREDINMKLYQGAEYYLDDGFERKLREGSLCTLGNQGKYILVELPMHEIPIYADKLLFEIQLKGLTPILAHPERNQGIIENPAYVYSLLAKGILMQINASSILGHFGQTIAAFTETMLKHNWVQFIASDAHSAGVRSPRLSEAVEKVEKIIGESVKDLVYNNPQKILKGEAIEIAPFKSYQPPKLKLFQKLKNIF